MLRKLLFLFIALLIVSLSSFVIVVSSNAALSVEPDIGYSYGVSVPSQFAYNVTYFQIYGYGARFAVDSGYVNVSMEKENIYFIDAINIYRYSADHYPDWIPVYHAILNVTKAQIIFRNLALVPGIYKLQFGENAAIPINESMSNINRLTQNFYDYLVIYLPEPMLLEITTLIMLVLTVSTGTVYFYRRNKRSKWFRP